MIRAVIFDLDGTLTDSLKLLATLTNNILKSFSLPTHPVESYKQFVGNGIEKLVQRVLPESSIYLKNQILDLLLNDMSSSKNSIVPLYDGIADMLDQLTQKHIHLNVLSNKPQGACELIEKNTFSRWKFSNFYGHSILIPHKPDPYGANLIINNLGISKEQCIYVGDSGVDMKLATQAQLYPIGVLWGFRSKEELIENGAKTIISSPSELVKLVEVL